MQSGYEKAKQFCMNEKPAHALTLLKEIAEAQPPQRDSARSAYLMSAIYFSGLLESQQEEPDDILALEDQQPDMEKMFRQGLKWLQLADSLGSSDATLLLGKIYLDGLEFFSDKPIPRIRVDNKEFAPFINKADFNADPEYGIKLLNKIKMQSAEAAEILRKTNSNVPGTVFQMDCGFWEKRPSERIPGSLTMPIPRLHSTGSSSSSGSNASMTDAVTYSGEDTDTDEICGSPII